MLYPFVQTAMVLALDCNHFLSGTVCFWLTVLGWLLSTAVTVGAFGVQTIDS
jgi:hypothetical protein